MVNHFHSIILLYLLILLHGVPASDAGTATGAVVGSLCSPPVGYLPLPCQTLNVISASSQPLPVNTNGVNVCEVTRQYLVRVYEYRYRQQCGWDYHSQYRYYYWSCRVECISSGVCSESTRVESTTMRQCCEGFAPQPVEYNQFNPFYSYYIPDNTQRQPSGCPLAVGNTILECLQIHGLNIFIGLINQAGLIHLVNSTDSKATVFAPPDEVLEGMIPTDIERFVRSHIILRPIDADMLYHSTQLESASGDVTLYVTLIEHYYYRPLLWTQPSKGSPNLYTYQNYHYNHNNFILLRTDRYISGSLITEPDACITDNGDLHLIDSFIPITNQSVVDIIEGTPNLSMFSMALDILNIKTFLTATNTPHTIFAPSNVAFTGFPMILIECLNQFDREPMNNLILYHIAEQVHYLSSLSQEKWLYTKLLRHMSVDVSNSGQVLLGDDQVTISVPNIAASDGVVHIVGDIIFPDMFDYGDCMPFIGSGMEITEENN